MLNRYKEAEIVVVGTSFQSEGGDWRSIYLYARSAAAGGGRVIVVNPREKRGWRQTLAVLFFSPRVIVNALASFQSWLVVLMCLLRKDVRLYLHETEYSLDAYRRSNPIRYRIVAFILGRNPILCVSRSAEGLYRKRFGAKETAVVYECPGDFDSTELDPNRVHIVNVASFEKRKGAKLFSKVADLAKERHPDWQFHWVGGSPESEEKPLSAAVEWHGFMWQPSEIVKRCRLFFLSSVDDPCPLSALEALRVGIGCVVYAKTGTAELVESLPGCAVFPDYTAHSALAAIEEALASSPAEAAEIQRAIGPTSLGNFGRSIESSFFPERANQPDRGWISTEQDVASPNLAPPPRVEWPEDRPRQLVEGAISVIIPAYNRASLIGQTLRALLHQTRPAAEILVIDDGSTDETVAAAEKTFAEFRSRHAGSQALPEFRVLRQANSGPAKARNLGLSHARGEFVHFFDSDDIPALNKQAAQAEALEREGADVAVSPWVKGRITEHGAWSGEQGAWSGERGGEAEENRYSFKPDDVVLQQHGLPKQFLAKELFVRWSIVPQACLFRRSILEQAGGFPEGLVFTEDRVHVLRCLLAGAKVVHVPETITYYRNDNADKITESAERALQRDDNLARGLMLMRADAIRHGIEPLNWTGFRVRCETAAQALEKNGGRNTLLVRQLRRYRNEPRIAYLALAKTLRITGGLSARLGGHRWNESYRCGQMTAAQADLFPRGL
jgi:glycosyltransferase involved in cell wall biosynthesis